MENAHILDISTENEITNLILSIFRTFLAEKECKEEFIKFFEDAVTEYLDFFYPDPKENQQIYQSLLEYGKKYGLN